MSDAEHSPERSMRLLSVRTSTRLIVAVILLVITALVWAQSGSVDTENVAQSISLTQIVLLIFLLAVSGFLSGSETSFTAIGQWKIRQLREEGDVAFGLLEKDPTRFITTCLIGSNLANIGATALITQLGITLALLSPSLSENAAVGMTTALMTILVLVFGEITPKALAVHHAEAVARFAIRPIYSLSVLLYPVGLAFTYVASSVLRLLNLEPHDNPLMTANELELMLRTAEESDVIEAHEREMIEGIIELEETVVREIMTPRVDMLALEESATLAAVHHAMQHEMPQVYSRLPVYGESLDDVKGIFYIRDLLDFLGKPEELDKTLVGDLMKPVGKFVPETRSILNLMREMRETKTHMSIVVDEFGGTSGIVTLEDIIEEITGEIYDETDAEEQEEMTLISQGHYQAKATVNMSEVIDELQLALENESDYDTLAGFLISRFDKIPNSGESYDFDNYRFTIEEADERRIISVVITAIPSPPQADVDDPLPIADSEIIPDDVSNPPEITSNISVSDA